MKSRPLVAGIAGIGVFALAATVWVVRGRSHGAPEQTVRVSVRHTATTEENDKELAPKLEQALASVPGITSQRLEITKFGITAQTTFARGGAANVEAVAKAVTARQATVMEEPPEVPAIWILASKDLTKELEAVGGVTVETCGEPEPSRVRVTVDTDKLMATMNGDIVDFELAVGTQALRQLMEWQEVDPEELGRRTVRGDVRIGDVATLTREPRPHRCSAFDREGKAVVTHTVRPLPHLSVDARAKVDGIARHAQASIVHDQDVIEARFAIGPSASYEARRRIAADYAVRAKVASGLDVVGSRVTYDGAGVLVVRRPASVDTLRSVIKENFGVSWGGIVGAHRLIVTIKGDDRSALEKRTKETQQRVSAMDGVGAPVLSVPGTVNNVVYDVDEAAAEAEHIPVPALKYIASLMQGDGPIEAGVVIDPPRFDKVLVRGRPLGAYIHPRERPQIVRLFRADGKPSQELAFEAGTQRVLDRVRQAFADSADVSARVLPPF